MSQQINLSVSGVWTAVNDFQGLPPGALNLGRNVESKYKNLLEPRRGFEGLPDSALVGSNIVKLTNFTIDGEDRIVGLDSDGNVYYYDETLIPNPWVAVPGQSTAIISPDSIDGKSRFIQGNQNLYLTSQDGIRSYSTGAAAAMLRSGVPKGLNLEAETNGSTSGFFNNNIDLSTSGDLTASTAIISNLADTTGLEIGQYVTGTDVTAELIVQDLTYTSELFGVLGNAITIAYTAGGTAGAEVVTVISNAISVQIDSGVSTATQVKAAIDGSAAALALVSVVVSGTAGTAQVSAASAPLAGGLDNTIPSGTKIESITEEATVIVQDGDTTAGSITIANLTSNAGIIAGLLVSGQGIPEGAKVVSLSGAGPYSVDLDVACFQDDTNVPITFTAPITVTMDANSLASLSGTPISFYAGAQVGYRLVFGRVETDVNGGSITRIGSPTAIAIATNTTPYSTNITVTATLPKNSDDRITFYQLYRSAQTETAEITPLDQYNLVYEGTLEAADFTARVITITDSVPDSLVGIPLYAGSDREGILQANDPPPMAWDMCIFRNFAIYGNVTYPSTTKFTIVSVGAPSGVQVDDAITITGTGFSETYTAKSAEDASAREFMVYSSGTPSQNITDTANSLIRVINFDNDVPVHAILLSSTTDLPGQILLEGDNPSLDTFTVNASLHQSAYDPELDNLTSQINTVSNDLGISKAGELEAVPATNRLPAGDSSSKILRVIALRDYVIVLKTDGVYKITGLSPNSLQCNAFDLTTKIIGADTAVTLNSGVWMLSNQGVTSIDDAGVNSKSLPIDDQINLLINSYRDNLVNQAFAVGYESDRKYILSVPDGNNEKTETQHIFNYVTNCWTSWDRELRTAFVHSNEGKLYISKAEDDDNGISKERKSNTFRDYVDESIDVTIATVVAANELELTSVSGIEVGDIIQQSELVFSPITEIDLLTNTVTTLYSFDWQLGDAEVLQAYECEITWKQQFGQNPAATKQFSEGQVLFKRTRFNEGELKFSTDFSQNFSSSPLIGQSQGLWGLYNWGEIPWGGAVLPSTIRFYVPQNKQMGSYIIPGVLIKQGFSNFAIQGMSISYYDIGQEVGR